MLSVKTVERQRNSVINSIFIQEGEFTVKNLITENEKFQAYHLRHRIFAQELGWIPPAENGLEVDDYDKNAISFGVLDSHLEVLAYMRLITAENTFMLEREFLLLIGPDHKVIKEADTAELSRCCVSPEVRRYRLSNEFGSFDIFSLLFKGIYQWCLINDIRYLYGVTDHRVYKLLQMKGLPFKLINKPQTMPDGVIAVAVIMDWRDFEILNILKRPNVLRWFTRYQSAPVQWQLQQHGFYS